MSASTAEFRTHGSPFDVTTGTVLRGQATDPLARYEARELDDEIQIRV